MPFASTELPAVIGVLIPVVALCIPIAAILSANWRRAKVAEYRAVMVQNMLDKGFTPDDIERVLRANDAGMSKLAGKHSRRESEHVR